MWLRADFARILLLTGLLLSAAALTGEAAHPTLGDAGTSLKVCTGERTTAPRLTGA